MWEEMPCATIYSTLECISSCSRCLASAAALTTALRHGMRKMLLHAGSDPQQLIFRLLSDRRKSPGIPQDLPWSVSPSYQKRSCLGLRHSLQILAALYGICMCPPASRMAESTEIGMASFRAQEKSTIRIASAFVTFLCEKPGQRRCPEGYRAPALSARCSALLSRPDFSLSDSSIMDTMLLIPAVPCCLP